MSIYRRKHAGQDMTERITLDRIDFILRHIFRYLKKAGGQASGKEVLAAIQPHIEVTPHELSLTNTGAVRWENHVRWYTTDCVKAGYLQKSGGMWTLTEKGEKALALPAGQLIRTASKEYRAWRKAEADGQEGAESLEIVMPAREEERAERWAIYEKARESARSEIDNHLDNMDPYDFQRLVAELLRGMGYYVRNVAAPGPDGGVDILAYMDPLGTSGPRIKVQVKHRESKVGAKDVREMEGLLRKDGDIGLIVSSGGFSSEAEREIRSSSKHIEAMNADRFVSLWQEHYPKISESGKSLLPLVEVFFLAPGDRDL